MKKCSIFLLAGTLFIGCAPRLTRIGYDFSSLTGAKECKIIIKENANVSEAMGEIIGTVKISDTGFSTNCSEDDVLNILRREACRLGANMVNITESQQPDMKSTCYRVTADLIRLNEALDIEKIESSEQFTQENIEEREETSKKLSRRIMSSIIAYGLGFILGYLLFQ